MTYRTGIIKAIQYIDGLEGIAQTLADNPDIGLKRDALSAGLLSFPLLHKRYSWSEHYQGATRQYGFCETY